MEALRWIWSYLRIYKYKYIGGLVLVLVMSFTAIINPFLAGKIIDVVVKQNQKQLLIPIIGIMLSVVLLRSIIRYSYQMIFEHVSQDIIMDIKTGTYKKLLALDFDYYNHTKTGDIMARMTGDTDAIRHFVSWVIYNVIANMSLFIFAIISMACVNIPLTIAVGLVCPFIAFFTVKMSKKVNPTFQRVRDAYATLNSVVQENISGNRMVKAFSNEQYEIQKFMKENRNYRDQNVATTHIVSQYLPILDMLTNLLSLVMILVGGILVSLKKMSLGDLVIFNGLLWALNNPMRSAGFLINDIERFIAGSIKIRELLHTKPKIKNYDTLRQVSLVKGHVVFDHVSFQYENTDALRDISFEIKPGQTVGIIGPTGSGKSTLINLICRFYECTSGKVLIDGVDVREYDLKKLRDNISITMQDVFLFSDTIASNIAYGIPEASENRVRTIASMVEADEFINHMPEGYSTIVGERGVGLSGGQRQRIALARALLKDPAILILDDTTSAVDMETEQKIQKEMKSEKKQRTTFIIAHRISSVQAADLILVLDKGKVIERGTHKELIKKRGYYYDVYESQRNSMGVEEEEA